MDGTGKEGKGGVRSGPRLIVYLFSVVLAYSELRSAYEVTQSNLQKDGKYLLVVIISQLLNNFYVILKCVFDKKMNNRKYADHQISMYFFSC